VGKSATNEQKEDRLARIPEAASRLGLSVWTLRAWIQEGKIASNKLGGRRLIPVSEIERLIKSTHVPARAVVA
jgi:excisionase family DNA binding protein